MLSETEVAGKERFCREPKGVKSPGEDVGVLFAVLSGIEVEGGRWVCSGCVVRAVDVTDEADCC